MLCYKPFVALGGSELPCGKCLNCRINQRNIWTARLLLEQTQHDETSFLTLTYNEENLPSDGLLKKRDYRVFLKKLRKQINKTDPDKRIKYYLCGEYGTINDRPHYHLILFGYGCPNYGLLKHDNIRKLNYYYPATIELLKCWPHGNIYNGRATPAAMAYNCSHLTKSLTDTQKAHGEQPQFHAMSKGLGKNAISAILRWLTTKEGAEHFEKQNDVPAVVRIDKKIRPIGKFLRNEIRDQLGMEKTQPDAAIRKRALEEIAKTLELGKDWKVIQRNKEHERSKQILQHRNITRYKYETQ